MTGEGQVSTRLQAGFRSRVAKGARYLLREDSAGCRTVLAAVLIRASFFGQGRDAGGTRNRTGRGQHDASLGTYAGSPASIRLLLMVAGGAGQPLCTLVPDGVATTGSAVGRDVSGSRIEAGRRAAPDKRPNKSDADGVQRGFERNSLAERAVFDGRSCNRIVGNVEEKKK